MGILLTLESSQEAHVHIIIHVLLFKTPNEKFGYTVRVVGRQESDLGLSSGVFCRMAVTRACRDSE